MNIPGETSEPDRRAEADDPKSALDGRVLIIGAGQGGAEAAILLRQYGHRGPITLVGEEGALPYMRPPLSKGLLLGEIGPESLVYKAASAYEKVRVELRLGARATQIDRTARRVRLETGAVLPYDRLILATGGRARRLKTPGADLANIFYLRSLADVERLRPAFRSGRRLVIVGGGYVGLECAAAAVKRGLEVTVLEAAERLLARVAAPRLSAFYEHVHRAAGVEIRLGVAVSGFEAGDEEGELGFVRIGDERLPADLALVGVGLVPNDELAAAAGLAVDAGVLVDEDCRTNDPDIFAIGDCAKHRRHGFLGRSVRLESVPNALEQARAAAAALTGRPRPAATPPWFWSDQYDLKLQTAGLSEGFDEVAVRGREQDRSFTVFYFKGGEIIAADAVNRPADFMAARRLIALRAQASAANLADEGKPLKELLKSVEDSAGAVGGSSRTR